ANCPNATNCRLRDAIAKAASGDTITFSVTGKIYLDSGELVITKNLTINGPGAAQLTISGINKSRGFNISSGFTVALSGLKIANGNPGGTQFGGGIYNKGTLTITNSTLSSNSAFIGGGIYNDNTATLTITASTLSDNKSGGIY